MATKKEIFETVSKEVQELAEKFGTKEPYNEELFSILTTHLAPKTAGMSVNLDEVTEKDADGNVSGIQCSLSKMWLPATSRYFYEEKTEGKGINGLKRLSRQAEAVRKQFLKARSATETAILTEVLSEDMTPEEAKKAIEEVRATAPDYSVVGILD